MGTEETNTVKTKGERNRASMKTDEISNPPSYKLLGCFDSSEGRDSGNTEGCNISLVLIGPYEKWPG